MLAQQQVEGCTANPKEISDEFASGSQQVHYSEYILQYVVQHSPAKLKDWCLGHHLLYKSYINQLKFSFLCS